MCWCQVNAQPHTVRLPTKYRMASVWHAMLCENGEPARGKQRHIHICSFDLDDLG